MLLTTRALNGLLGTIAIVALLPVAYGFAMRRFERPAAAQATLGALFGAAAVHAFATPSPSPPA